MRSLLTEEGRSTRTERASLALKQQINYGSLQNHSDSDLTWKPNVSTDHDSGALETGEFKPDRNHRLSGLARWRQRSAVAATAHGHRQQKKKKKNNRDCCLLSSDDHSLLPRALPLSTFVGLSLAVLVALFIVIGSHIQYGGSSSDLAGATPESSQTKNRTDSSSEDEEYSSSDIIINSGIQVSSLLSTITRGFGPLHRSLAMFDTHSSIQVSSVCNAHYSSDISQVSAELIQAKLDVLFALINAQLKVENIDNINSNFQTYIPSLSQNLLFDSELNGADTDIDRMSMLYDLDFLTFGAGLSVRCGGQGKPSNEGSVQGLVNAGGGGTNVYGGGSNDTDYSSHFLPLMENIHSRIRKFVLVMKNGKDSAHSGGSGMGIELKHPPSKTIREHSKSQRQSHIGAQSRSEDAENVQIDGNEQSNQDFVSTLQRYTKPAAFGCGLPKLSISGNGGGLVLYQNNCSISLEFNFTLH